VKYLKPIDTIIKLGFSNRAYNVLKRNNINTIAELLAYDRALFLELRNLGVKTLEEICAVIDGITIMQDPCDAQTENSATIVDFATEPVLLFRDDRCILREDIPIEEIGLSNRSYNGLKIADYHYASQLLTMDKNALHSISGLGEGCVSEILDKVKGLSFKKAQDDPATACEKAHCLAFVSKAISIVNIHGGKLCTELLPIFEGAEEALKPQQRDIFAVEYLRDAVKDKIHNILAASTYGMTHAELIFIFPNGFIHNSILDEILDEMEQSGLITVGSRIQHRKINLHQYAETIPSDKDREIFQKRLTGLTLEEIGGQYGVTRERIRQIVARWLKKRPPLAEDIYIDMCEKYSFSQQEFTAIFDEDIATYIYLMTVCDTRGDLPIRDMLSDESFPIEIRQAVETFVYKNYLTIGIKRVYKSRVDITDYVLRKYFLDAATLDDFIKVYNTVLEGQGLSEDENLVINMRYYENRLAESSKTLWKQGRRFRYYDIESYDFTELWQVLAFDQYQDVEYSTQKFFRDHPELMYRYDIRDEYELHNLLKKQYARLKDGYLDSDPASNSVKLPEINFGRMPMLEIGNANRDSQVLDMLIDLTPVSIYDFAEAYNKEYGVSPVTFMTNFVKNISEYFYDGMYEISRPSLTAEQFAIMSEVLSEDYYEISAAKQIYLKRFPDESPDNINPYTLKTLGFNVYATYIVKNNYASAADYFRKLLTNDDLFDTGDFPPGPTVKGSYSGEFMAIKKNYQIIEYEPNKYISLRDLNKAGVTIDQLQSYVSAVVDFIPADMHFTVTSLYKAGFSHLLDELGFGEVFYASLLSEDSRISYQRMGGAKLFCIGIRSVSIKSLVEYLVEAETAIGCYVLAKMLKRQYGLTIGLQKIKEVIKDSPLHYDEISRKIFIDYDTYLNECKR